MTILDDLIHSNKPYYFGEIERPDAEQALYNKPSGTWLIRLSPKDKSPVISYIQGGHFGHIKGALDPNSNQLKFTVQGRHQPISNLDAFPATFSFLGAPCPKPNIQPASFNMANPQPASFSTPNSAPAIISTPTPAPVEINKAQRKSVRKSQQFKMHEPQTQSQVQQNVQHQQQQRPLPQRSSRTSHSPSLTKAPSPADSNIYDVIPTQIAASSNIQLQDVIYYQDPAIAIICRNLTPLPSSMNKLTGGLDDKIKIHQVIGTIAEATNPKTETTGFICAGDYKITTQTKGISKKELDSQHTENASDLASQQRFLEQYESKIGKSIKIHSKPVMKLKIEPEEIGLAPNKQLPTSLPSLQCEVVSIQREYFMNDTHIGFGYDPISRDKKGFFHMSTCYSAS